MPRHAFDNSYSDINFLYYFTKDDWILGAKTKIYLKWTEESSPCIQLPCANKSLTECEKWMFEVWYMFLKNSKSKVQEDGPKTETFSRNRHFFAFTEKNVRT